MITPEALAHLRAADPTLAAIVEAVGPATPVTREPTFAALVTSIIAQQISTSAAAAITRRVLDVARELTPEALLAVRDEDLRAAGLSRAKMVTIRGLAERAASGDLLVERLHELEDAEIIAHLSKSRGIGRWTAEMFLMFRLHRPDVLPVGDLGIVKAVQKVYGLRKLPTADRLVRIGESWRPYRSVACWYLWASLHNAPLKE